MPRNSHGVDGKTVKHEQMLTLNQCASPGAQEDEHTHRKREAKREGSIPRVREKMESRASTGWYPEKPDPRALVSLAQRAVRGFRL